jgi:outer membrane biosynthesis protein TonB
MKELLIKHEIDGRVINRFRVKPVKKSIFTIGSSKNANIRILGDDIDPIHAGFELRNGKWHIIDLGSNTGTWVNNKTVVENQIQVLTDVKVGSHCLSVEPVEVIKHRIFQEEKKIDMSGAEVSVYQQVAVFFHNELLESYLEPPKKNLKVPFGNKVIEIKPPVSADWVENKMGDYLVKNRLVRSPKFKNEDRTIWSLFPKDLARPFSYAFGATFVFFLAMYIIPKALNSDPGEIQDNQYTKLIFDQKAIEKQKKKVQKITKKIEKQKPLKRVAVKKPKRSKAGATIKNTKKQLAKLAPSRSNTKVNAKVSKVVSRMQASGLSSLVSKVSQRAAKNALVVKSKGFKAEDDRGGRAFASINDVKKGAKLGSAAKLGSFRVAGVSTNGVAGGSAVSSRLGGLSGTGIGSASVGSIEEETEVEGGLTADQIARVVKQNLGAVRYCYERQLAANPNLYGKIKVQFVIAPTGKVTTQSIKSSTMKSALVEGCILRKIKRWAFPLPKGGTEVAVSYPFYFKSTK